MNTPTLETQRLILRRFTPDDAQALYQILSDEEVNTFLPMFPLKTLEEASAYMQKQYLDTYQEPFRYRYAVCLKTDHIPIGYVQVSSSESHDFGYGLRKDFWHKGIITEADIPVTFRMYQLNFDGQNDRVYKKYWEQYPVHFIEDL